MEDLVSFLDPHKKQRVWCSEEHFLSDCWHARVGGSPPQFSLLNHFFLCSLSRLDVISIVYKKGAIVVLAAEDYLPVFGEAQHVVAVNVDQYYFVVVILHTVCFKPHSMHMKLNTPVFLNMLL